MAWVVVGYYTVGTLYETEAKRLIPSFQKFNIPYFISPTADQGSWYKNTQFKPTFLKSMMQQFASKSIIYVDIDAEFMQYPDLFDQLDQRPDVHIGVHLLDHAKRGRPQAGFEMLSGTVYLKNTSIVHQVIDTWIQKCSVGGLLWDQVALKDAIGSVPYYILPEQYCMIFDYMSDVQNPVIKHYQASRRCKNIQGPTPEANHMPVSPNEAPKMLNGLPPHPRKVVSGGLVRYHRKWRGLGTV